MQLNKMNFLMGFVMADSAKKHMTEKGIDVPNNFVANQALLSGMLPQPHTASFLLQNEVQKRDAVISPVAEKKIKEAEARIEELDADNKHYKGENERLDKDNKVLKEKIDDFNNTTIGKLQEQVEALEADKESNRKKIDDLTGEVKNYEAKLKELADNQDAFLTKVSDFRTYLAGINDRTVLVKEVVEKFNTTFPEPEPDATVAKSVKTKAN